MPSASLQQGLSQQQTLAPQMRQSLELLQASSLELQQLLAQNLVQNPVLEEVPDSESLDAIIEQESPDPEATDDWQESYEDDLRELAIMEKRTTGQNREAEELREHLYNSIVAPETLQNHLTKQLLEAAEPPEVTADARIIISNLDERGYLDQSLEELSDHACIPWDDLETALTVVQSLEPPGVGARSLQDCLLLQLERRGEGLSLAAEIVRNYLEDLARNHKPKIAKSLGIEIKEVAEAAAVIGRLDPAPGTSFDATRNPFIQADVVFQIGDDQSWEAQLTGNYIPKIRVNDHYKDLMSQINTDRKTRTYLKNNLRDARSLLRAIDQRQETILAISREIVAFQTDFLNHGPKKLRPLTMNEVAEKIGVHPTTVSRAVAGKFARTPWGMMELRRFFTSGYQTREGEEISNQSVREALQKLIEEENPHKPLSDEKLAKMLSAKGVKVARRTVAKYRGQLGILSSNLRKKHTKPS